MGRILQLDESLANMIAAGEVVENMASVVKELVENAIDAEAERVDIRLKDSGLKEIRVTDDGEGMDEEDIEMAFRRHATSKIKTEHDLHHIASLGFRGEALPSIASVSVVGIDSAFENKSGTFLLVKNGEIVEKTAGRAKKGTTVFVRDLFYNTPARLKHLRSEKRELADVVDIVNKLALAHPDVRFHLSNNDKTILATPGDGDVLKVLREIYPLDVIKNLLAFENENRYFHIKGYISKPSHTRSSRAHMAVVTNRRAIKSPRVQNAILSAYRTYLFGNRFPIAHLEIIVDPLLIDVNIHPQKLSVKFTEEKRLLELVEATVKETLKGADLIERMRRPERKETAEQSRLDFSHPSRQDMTEEKARAYGKEEDNTEEDTPSSGRQTFPDLAYIGQAFGTYLLFQDERNLYLMDQHAAAERVRYETIQEALETKDSGIRPLLHPLSINLSNRETESLSDIAEELSDQGISHEVAGPTSLAVKAVPDWFPEGEEEAFAEKTIRLLLEEKTISRGRFLDHAAKELACKTSIRANKYLEKHEIDRLVRDLSHCENPFTCPHGRPTLIAFSDAEIETMFKRVVK